MSNLARTGARVFVLAEGCALLALALYDLLLRASSTARSTPEATTWLALSLIWISASVLLRRRSTWTLALVAGLLIAGGAVEFAGANRLLPSAVIGHSVAAQLAFVQLVGHALHVLAAVLAVAVAAVLVRRRAASAAIDAVATYVHFTNLAGLVVAALVYLLP